jgi:hypothetical protein
MYFRLGSRRPRTYNVAGAIEKWRLIAPNYFPAYG